MINMHSAMKMPPRSIGLVQRCRLYYAIRCDASPCMTCSPAFTQAMNELRHRPDRVGDFGENLIDFTLSHDQRRHNCNRFGADADDQILAPEGVLHCLVGTPPHSVRPRGKINACREPSA